MGTYAGVFDKPSQTPLPTQQSSTPPSSSYKLYQGVYDENGVQQQSQGQGFFDWLKNLSINGAKTGSFLSLLDPTIFGNLSKYTDPQTMRILREDLPKMLDGVFNITGKGDPMSVAMAIGNKLAENQFARPTEDGMGGLGDLAKGFLKPISDLMELNSGLQLTENDIVALTPEQKAARIKSTIGLLAATAVAGPLAEALPTGTLAQRMIGNTITGAATGATYGTVASAGDKDALGQIIQNGIFGGTLGVAHSILFGRSAGKVRPEDIAQIRSLISPDNSLAESTNIAKALVSSNDIAEALLTGKVGLKPNDIHIIPGIDPATLFRLNAKLPEGYRSALHVADDGTGRLLVYDENLLSKISKPSSAETLLSNPDTYKNLDISQLANEFVTDAGELSRGASNNNPNFTAAVQGKLSALRLRGFSDEEILRLATNRQQELGYAKDQVLSSIDRLRATLSNLKSPKLESTQTKLNLEGEKFFEKNGLVQGQIASYLGKENWEVLDATKDGIKLKNVVDGSVVTANKNDIRLPDNMSIVNKHAGIIDRLYNDFKSSLVTPPEQASANAAKYEPIGIDDTPPASFIDRIPELDGFNTLKGIDDFLNAKGFKGDDFTNLHREIQLKIAKEVYESLPKADQDLINKANQQTILDRQVTGKQRVKTFNDLQRYAKSNGFRVQDAGSGRYAIRSLDDNKILAGADNVEAAKAWIDKAGQAKGPNLADRGTSIESNIASGGGDGIPPSDPPKTPFDAPHDFIDHQAGIGKWETVARFLDNGALWTRYHDFMSHLDSKYGTQFLQKIHETLNQTRNIRNNMAKPYIKEWEVLRRSFKGGEKEAKLIKDYIETMSPEEVISKFMSRPMNPNEIRAAQSFAGSKADLEAVFKYRNEVEKLDREYPQEIRSGNADKEMEYQQQKAMAKQAFKLDDAGLNVANQMDLIEQQPKDEMSLGAVVRLARSIDNGLGQREMTRAQFAQANKMTLEQINHANKIEDFYRRLAKAFNVNPANQLGGYATHAALFYDNDVPKAIRSFSGDVKTRDFFAKLTRTGEISATETNAFKGLLRYIKGGFDVQSGFADALSAARTNLEKELLKLEGGTQEKARRVIGQYINDMQGMPEAGDRATKTAVEYLKRKFNINMDEQTSRNWATAINSLVNAGALGLRPMLGIGHFGISSVISWAARNESYTARMLKNGADAIANRIGGDGAIMAELQAKGVFQGLSPFSVMKADVDPGFSSKIGRVIDKAQDAMFKVTLLPTVYDGMAAGHYLTTYQDVLTALNKFSKGEINSNQFAKDTFIRRYDLAVQKRFMDIAKDVKNASRIEDAAHYLGMNAVEDLVGTYGSGNTPYLWGTNAGRIVGQFGNYAMWIRGTLERMATRGTIGDRIGAVAKVGAAMALTHYASEETGIDITRMSPVHALTWMFGPLVHVAEDAMDAVHSSGYQQQQALRRLGRVLPLDSDGNIHPSIFIPGSFAVDGIVQAADDFSQGNAGTGIAHAAGFRNYGQQEKPTP